MATSAKPIMIKPSDAKSWASYLEAIERRNDGIYRCSTEDYADHSIVKSAAQSGKGLGGKDTPSLLTQTTRLDNTLSEAILDMDEGLLDAFLATQFKVFADGNNFILSVSQRSAELAELMANYSVTTACFITGFNPYSKITSEQNNRLNNASLRHDLVADSAEVFDGAGQDELGKWPAELSFVALGLSCGKAIELGQKYGQLAVVWIDDSAIPKLLITGGYSS